MKATLTQIHRANCRIEQRNGRDFVEIETKCGVRDRIPAYIPPLKNKIAIKIF